jgi:3-hydroxybutyryl-CoA dehydrogenase
MNSIKTVGIIGAGTMGLGIAQVCAVNGYKVLLYDNSQAALAKAEAGVAAMLSKGIARGKISEQEAEIARQKVEYVAKLEKITADFVIEAIVEDLNIKQKLFSALEKINEPTTIFATNTSSIPVTTIAAQLIRPENFVGLHFFNPAHIMKLVEVIAGIRTSEHTVTITKLFAETLNKTVVSVLDSPGFIVNRVARHFYVESLKVLEEGVADITTIDNLIEASGFKLGPFRLLDLIGVDTNLSVTQSMYDAFNQEAKFRPNRIQQRKVDAGHWGKKTGKGFYDYDAPE